MSSDPRPLRSDGDGFRRFSRRARTWRDPVGLFSSIRSFRATDTATVARVLLSAFFLGGFSLAVIVPLALFSALVYFVRDIPPVQQVMDRPVFQTTRIYDRNGVLLYELNDPDQGQRLVVHLNQLPRSLIDATIAVEDPTFFSNPGIDPLSIVRAAAQDVTSHGIVSGASTLTQQLARNVLFTDVQQRESQTLDRKIKEAIFAFELTQTYSKPEILEMYFNEVNYGNHSYGVGAAAESYFGKPVSQLDLAQSALLAGLPQAPSSYDPNLNMPAARARQAYVLDRMVLHGYITAAQAEQAKQEPLTVHQATFGIKAPHFVNYVTQLIEQRYGHDALYDRGWRIQTTLDLGLDQIAQAKARERVDQVRQEMNAHNACVVTIQPSTGEILTMVGSLDYFDTSIQGQVNVCTSPRQPGSSVKVFNYVTAYERGFVPDSIVYDVKTAFDRGPGLSPYVPLNFDFQFHGPVMLREALGSSLNIAAVKLLQRVGVHAMDDTAHAMGITTMTDPDRYGLTLTLGAADVTPLDMAFAYSAFANDGSMVGEPVPLQDRVLGMRRYEPVAILKITDSSGNVVYQYHPPPPIQVVSPQAAYLITSSLTDDHARHFTFAPGGALNVGFPAAAKTGTTQLEQDAWTMGYTPDLAVGIWVGNTDGTPMKATEGVLSAGAIWHTYMPAAVKYLHLPEKDFKVPPGVVHGNVCGKVDWYIQNVPPICTVG
ncbi:MAG TPA: transglycosylase domain-containing protein [Chloroflexota bacterium]|nr:transglycosylase domain-containing protein [Chloroflexota bacterium]